MKITLDENGKGLPDTKLNEEARNAIQNNADFHVCNLTAIQALRAELLKIPVDQRPPLEWVFYGIEVSFDKDMRSMDAWSIKQDAMEDELLDTPNDFCRPDPPSGPPQISEEQNDAEETLCAAAKSLAQMGITKQAILQQIDTALAELEEQQRLLAENQ